MFAGCPSFGYLAWASKKGNKGMSHLCGDISGMTTVQKTFSTLRKGRRVAIARYLPLESSMVPKYCRPFVFFVSFVVKTH